MTAAIGIIGILFSLAEFYFQRKIYLSPTDIFKRPSDKIVCDSILSTLLFSISLFPFFIFFQNISIVIPIITCIFARLLIDFLFRLILKIKNSNLGNSIATIYTIKELLIIALLSATYFWCNKITPMAFKINIEYQKLIWLIAIFLLLIKPSSCVVKTLHNETFTNSDNIKRGVDLAGNEYDYSIKLQGDYNNENVTFTGKIKDLKDTSGSVPGNIDKGMIIGVLERFVIFFLVVLEAYISLGLIITMKTWARSSELKKCRDFGNKYLVGTLLSIGIAIALGFFYKTAFNIKFNI